MGRADQHDVRLRIVIDRPVAGVVHSLQSKDDKPLDPQRAAADAPLRFDLTIRVGPGPKFFGDQVRREGPVRRFVYVRIGQLAGDHGSPWRRRMKIDIHDIPPPLLEQAMASGTIELTVNGTGSDGTPACATVPVIMRKLI